MDPHARLEDLRTVIEKLDIEIIYSRLADSEMATHSGYCKLNDKKMIIMDKTLLPEEQIAILLNTLQQFDLENVYIPLWIREHLENHQDT